MPNIGAMPTGPWPQYPFFPPYMFHPSALNTPTKQAISAMYGEPSGRSPTRNSANKFDVEDSLEDWFEHLDTTVKGKEPLYTPLLDPLNDHSIFRISDITRMVKAEEICDLTSCEIGQARRIFEMAHAVNKTKS
jgi:hypothetical protein